MQQATVPFTGQANQMQQATVPFTGQATQMQQGQLQAVSQTRTIQLSLLNKHTEALNQLIQMENQWLTSNMEVINDMNNQDPNWTTGNSALAIMYRNYQNSITSEEAQIVELNARANANRQAIAQLNQERTNRIIAAHKMRRMIGMGYGVSTVILSGSLGYLMKESTELLKNVIEKMVGPALITLGDLLTYILSTLNYITSYMGTFIGSIPQDYQAIEIKAINTCIKNIVDGFTSIAGTAGWGAGIMTFILSFLFFGLIYQLLVVNKKYKIGRVGWLPTMMLMIGITQEEIQEEDLDRQTMRLISNYRQENARIEDDQWQQVQQRTQITAAREVFNNAIASRGFFQARAVNLITLFGGEDPALVDYQRVAGPGANPRVEEIEGGKKTRKKNRNLKKKKKSKKNKKTKRKISKKNKKSKKNKRSKKR
jgi:hypothetical protein